MTELLVAGLIGVMLLGVTIMVFTNQEKTMKHENDATEIRAKGRQSINEIAKLVRMAGVGLPPNQGITAMTATSISFRSNLDDVATTAPPQASGSSAISAGGSSMNVIDSSAFAANDYMVIYDPAFKTVHYAVVTGKDTASTPNTISFTPAIPGAITFTTNARYVSVNQYQNVTIALSGTDIVKTVDPTSTGGDESSMTITNKAFAGTGLAFAYYDESFAVATATSTVRKVSITLRMPDSRAPTDASLTKEFKTDVELRNTR